MDLNQENNSTTPIDEPICPTCGQKGKAVKPITLQSLLTEKAAGRFGSLDGFRFCSTPGCEVAYYRPGTTDWLADTDVRVPIGQKQTDSSRKVCYCFDHTAADIEADVAATGTSTIPEDIAAKCKQGMDRCPETNPQGSCCLGNVKEAFKEAQAKHCANDGHREPVAVAASCCNVDTAEETEGATELDCCGQPVAAKNGGSASAKGGLIATGGAVVAAILSSACCWLPLLLIAFGASAAGVAGFFEEYRLIFLGATGVLLVAAFYLVYRKPRCAPGEACAVPNTRLRRFNKGMLWVATVVVIALALFPNYVGTLIGSGSNDDGQEIITANATPDQLYRVEGMTCGGCSAQLESELAKLPGVTRVDVSYPDKTAKVFFKGSVDHTPSEQDVLTAIEKSGFSGVPITVDQAININITGMTCEGCAAGLADRLKQIKGIKAAAVDFNTKQAVVLLHPDIPKHVVLDAIRDEGYEGMITHR